MNWTCDSAKYKSLYGNKGDEILVDRVKGHIYWRSIVIRGYQCWYFSYTN